MVTAIQEQQERNLYEKWRVPVSVLGGGGESRAPPQMRAASLDIAQFLVKRINTSAVSCGLRISSINSLWQYSTTRVTFRLRLMISVWLARIADLEHLLPKQGVASSNLVTRSSFPEGC